MDKKKSKISDKVFDKIKKEEVKPIPKWHFVLKNGFLWVLLLILILMTIEVLIYSNNQFIKSSYAKLLSIPFTLWGISLFGTFAGSSFIYFQF